MTHEDKNIVVLVGDSKHYEGCSCDKCVVTVLD